MKTQKQRRRKVCAALLFSASFVLILFCLAQKTQAELLACRQVYSVCTEGGCDAQPGWKTISPCGIWCDPEDNFAKITCDVPPPR